MTVEKHHTSSIYTKIHFFRTAIDKYTINYTKIVNFITYTTN